MRDWGFTRLWRSLQIILGSLLVCMGMLVLVPIFQRQPASSADILRTDSELETHIDHLSANLLEYLSHHRIEVLTDIARDGRIIDGLIEEYKNSLGADQLAVFSQVDSASQNFRKATLQIIASDTAEQQDRAQLTDLHNQLTDAMEKISPASRRSARQIGVASHLIADIDALQAQTEKDALSQMTWFQEFLKAHQELGEILRGNEFTTGFQPNSRFKRHKLLAGVLAALCLLAGLCLAGLEWLLRLRLFHPLRDLVLAVDAAASGDFSRVPDIWAQDEAGRLAKAINRLITVLARSENLVYHLATLLDSSGDGIISQTLEGAILSWNKGAQRIYGYSAEEVKGQPISFLAPHDTAGRLMDVLERVKRGEKIQPFEMTHEGKGGRVVHVFLRVAAIYDSTRKVIGVSISAQDLYSPDSTSSRATPHARASGDYSHADDAAADANLKTLT